MRVPWNNIDEFREAAQALPWAKHPFEPLPVPKNYLSMFIVESIWNSEVTINLDQVKGTTHPDYENLNWISLLYRGKRMKRNISELLSNPNYYCTTKKKAPTMSYIRHSDGYWVDADGNHRTCIGRFFLHLTDRNPFLHGVEVREVRIDVEAYSKWLAMGGFGGPLRVEAVQIARDDGPGWMRERYRLRYFVREGKYGEKEVIRSRFLEFSESQQRGLMGLLKCLWTTRGVGISHSKVRSLEERR